MSAMDFFFSDPQAAASRFGDAIDDLHDVFRCNGVDFGSPDDFSAFARTMKYHSELRSDVMRVVKFVMDNEANVSFRTILTILAVASGGPEVTIPDREMRIPVSQIIESLVGAGDCSPLNAEQLENQCSESFESSVRETVAIERSSSGSGEAAAEAETNGALVEVAAGEEPASDSSLDQKLPIDPPIDPPIGRNTAMGRGDSNALTESLSRLEMNSLQLKIYLDSIEQRISRMEPRLENVSPASLPGPSVQPRDQAGARFSSAIASAAVFSAAGAELSDNDSSAATARQESRAAGPPAMHGHLWRDSRQFLVSKSQRALPVLGGIAILLLAVSVFWRVGRATGYVVVRPANALVQETGNVGGSDHARSAIPGADDPSLTHAGKMRGEGPAPVYNYASERSRLSADTPVSPPRTPARVVFRPSPSSSSAGNAKSAAAMTDTSEATDRTDRTDKMSSDRVPDHPVNVSSGVMAANLISGPKPNYPALASLTHTRGDVEMLAVISKDGTVKDLHVIKGHRLLRSAAKSAVRNWRYRPYMINGVPVDVSTLVSVDFSSPQ
ncbi:MAG TPA: TonB family protein [Edaphobacter sp.]|nr:TonB family protein [Edaphobacter sp.]